MSKVTPRMVKSVFVEPVDTFTNQFIAGRLLTAEEHYYENKLAEDGSTHSVWEFEPINKDKLMMLIYNDDARFNIFRERRRKLVSISRDDVPVFARGTSN